MVFKEGLNEDLAATAVWGSQQANLFPGAPYDGVFGMWYGKAPGVDRTGDAFKHANFAGIWPKGGVLAVAGDDHTCKSSTLPSQSEYAFQDFEMPVLSPADVQEVLDYGLLGYALSRFSGLWVGLIALADTMDSRRDHRRRRWTATSSSCPEGFRMPPGGLGIRLKDQPMDKERRLRDPEDPRRPGLRPRQPHRPRGAGRRAPAARHRLPGPGLQGRASRRSRRWASATRRPPTSGVAIYKVGMPWPLEPHGLRAFAAGLETLMVIEHKRPLIETQARAALYDLPAHARPKIIGKIDEQGQPLLSELGSLSVAEIALAIADRLPPGPHMERVHDYLGRVSAASHGRGDAGVGPAAQALLLLGLPAQLLDPPAGGLPRAGRHRLPLHGQLQRPLRPTSPATWAARGSTWVGASPFTSEKHVFVNLGDGTYNHSGSLAIRASVAAEVNITYKLLFNDAVAMTGGQPAESGFTAAQITRQLAAEGVAKTVIVAAEPERYEGVTDLAPGVEVARAPS